MKVMTLFIIFCIAVFLWGAIANLMRFSSSLLFRASFDDKVLLQFILYAFLATGLLLFVFENPRTFEIEVVPNNHALEKKRLLDTHK